MIIICVYTSKPLVVKVNKPKYNEGQKNIFEVLKKSLEDTNERQKDQGTLRKLRDSACQSIKVHYIIIYF